MANTQVAERKKAVFWQLDSKKAPVIGETEAKFWGMGDGVPSGVGIIEKVADAIDAN